MAVRLRRRQLREMVRWATSRRRKIRSRKKICKRYSITINRPRIMEVQMEMEMAAHKMAAPMTAPAARLVPEPKKTVQIRTARLLAARRRKSLAATNGDFLKRDTRRNVT